MGAWGSGGILSPASSQKTKVQMVHAVTGLKLSCSAEGFCDNEHDKCVYRILFITIPKSPAAAALRAAFWLQICRKG